MTAVDDTSDIRALWDHARRSLQNLSDIIAKRRVQQPAIEVRCTPSGWRVVLFVGEYCVRLGPDLQHIWNWPDRKEAALKAIELADHLYTTWGANIPIIIHQLPQKEEPIPCETIL